MTSLAHVRYSTKFDDGIVLKGFISMLFPTLAVSHHNSIQWHFVSAAKGERMPISMVKGFPWVKITDLETAANARTFLGYFQKSRIRLGTVDSEYEKIDFSKAKNKTSRFSLSSLTATLGIPQVGGPAGSGTYTLTRSLIKKAKTEDFDAVLRTAGHLPFILYNPKASLGWLVPATSVLLHMAMA
jgi:hypothetical protein